MSKKNSLPDSLELLLDTMCNTFGGIMFIAISLIIVSSMVTKTVTSLLPEEIDAAAIKKFEAESEELRKRIEELQQEENSLLQDHLKNLSPERLKVMQDIVALKQKNKELKKQWDDQDIQRRVTQKKNSVEKQKVEQQQAKNKAAENKVRAQKEKQEKLLASQKAKTEKIKKEFEAYVPKQLTFSMEEATDKAPYFIGLTKGKIFHIGTNGALCTNEITEERNDLYHTVTFHLRPGKGVSVGRGSDSIFNMFFRNISPDQYFIWLAVGEESFSEFYKAKQYLRHKGFHVYWQYNPLFQFSYGSPTSYKASQ